VEELVTFTNPRTAGHVKLEALLRALPRTVVSAVESFTRKPPRFLKLGISTAIGARLRVP